MGPEIVKIHRKNKGKRSRIEEKTEQKMEADKS